MSRSVGHLVFDPGIFLTCFHSESFTAEYFASSTNLEIGCISVLFFLFLSFYVFSSFWTGFLFDPPEDKSKRVDLPPAWPWRMYRHPRKWNHRMKPTNYGVRMRMAKLEQMKRPLRCIKAPRWMRRRKPPKVKLKWAKLDPEEAETDWRQDFDQMKHKLFKHSSTLFYELQFGVSLDDFVATLDPIRQWHMV